MESSTLRSHRHVFIPLVVFIHQNRLGKAQFLMLAAPLVPPALEEVGWMLQADGAASWLWDFVCDFLGQVAQAVVGAVALEGFLEEVHFGVCGEGLGD